MMEPWNIAENPFSLLLITFRLFLFHHKISTITKSSRKNKETHGILINSWVIERTKFQESTQEL